jgi:hypothetical protein
VYDPVTPGEDTHAQEETSMAKESKAKIENLELNRETIQDLAGSEAEAARGGMMVERPRPGTADPSACKHSVCDSCYATDCCLMQP